MWDNWSQGLDVCVKFISWVVYMWEGGQKNSTSQKSFMMHASLIRCRGMEGLWQAACCPCTPKLPSSPSQLRSVTGGCCWWWIAAPARIWHLPYMNGANSFLSCLSPHKGPIPGLRGLTGPRSSITSLTLLNLFYTFLLSLLLMSFLRKKMCVRKERILNDEL